MFSELIYKGSLDEVHTSEAYFGKVLFLGKDLSIPYINLGISNHSLNESDDLKFIDYCYFIAIDIFYLKINEKILINSSDKDYDSSKSIYLGGEDLLKNQLIYDIEIQASNAFLQLQPSSKLSKNFWCPVNTPNFEKNMNEKDVEIFINNKNIPENLLEIFREQ